MKLFLDFFPILVFFIVFKFYGIYVATGAFIITSFIQIAIHWLQYRRFEKMHIITFVLGVVFGAATLLLHDELFIKWKPTAIYWVFGLILLAKHFIGEKTILQSLIGHNLNLPQKIWRKLNFIWAVFFIVMGFLNLYVVYHFDTNTWVNFKLFGTLGLTIVFIIGQGIYLSRYIKTEDQTTYENK